MTLWFTSTLHSPFAPWSVRKLYMLTGPLFTKAFFADVCHFDCCQTPYTPEQIHISTGSDPTTMTVQWTTLMNSPSPLVQYGTVEGAYSQSTNATTDTFLIAGWHGFVSSLGSFSSILLKFVSKTDSHRRNHQSPAWNSLLLSCWRPHHQLLERSWMESATWDELCYACGEFELSENCHIWRHGLSLNYDKIYSRTQSMLYVGVTDISTDTIFLLNELVQNNAVDFMFHIGDIAYSDGFDCFLNFIWNN